jgi:hypothetical protein
VDAVVTERPLVSFEELAAGREGVPYVISVIEADVWVEVWAAGVRDWLSEAIAEWMNDNLDSPSGRKASCLTCHAELIQPPGRLVVVTRRGVVVCGQCDLCTARTTPTDAAQWVAALVKQAHSDTPAGHA